MSSSLRQISTTWSRRCSSGVYSKSTYDGRNSSGFQAKPWLDERYEIRRGGPSGSSAILIVVYSSLANAELRRLGRRACTTFRFCAEREEGLFAFVSGVLGELEYEDDDEGEPLAALDDCRRWQRSNSMAEGGGAGIVIEDDMLRLREAVAKSRVFVLKMALGKRLYSVQVDCVGRRSARLLLLPTGYPEPGGKAES